MRRQAGVNLESVRPRPSGLGWLGRTHPAASLRIFEELLQREHERGCKPGWARHVWAARERST
jgi:hypothetical protein